MTGRSDKPFVPALRDLMAERELSFRKLAYLTGQHRPDGKPLSLGYLSMLAAGERVPTPDNLETLARAAGARPEYFVEWREHVAAERARSLVERHGLDQVLKALDRLEKR